MKGVMQLPRTIWILGWASLFTDISSEMIHAVLPLFLVAQLGAGGLVVGLIDGLAEAMVALSKLFSGYLSDRYRSRKPLIVFGYALSAASKSIFAIAATPAVVLLARLSDRLGKGIRGAPRDALVADVTSKDNRGAAFGLRQSMDSAGAFVGPLLASALLFSFAVDYRLVFSVAIVPAVVSVLLLVFGLSSKPHDTASPMLPKTESSIKLTAQFWWLFAVSLIFSLGNSSDAFIILQARQIGFEIAAIPLLLVVMNVAYASTAYPAGCLSDKVSRKVMLLASFVLYALIYAGLALAQHPWQMWALLLAYGAYLGMSQGALLSLVGDYVGSEYRGRAYGLINLAWGLTLLPASLIAGWLWDNVNPAACFAAGAFWACVAACALLLAPLDKSRE